MATHKTLGAEMKGRRCGTSASTAPRELRRSIMTHRMHRPLHRRFALAVALLAFTAVIGAQTPTTPTPAAPTQSAPMPAALTPAWKSYSYPADGFSASFPSEPELQKRDVPTDAGTFELRSYIGTDGAVAMFIGVCDYGAQAAGKDPDTLLQGAKNGALTNSKSHLLSEKKMTLGIYHGLTFEAESDTAHFSARVYMVGTTLYQTLVVYPLGKPYADTTRFLDSFQLIARVAK
jgi:hypothetical protein